MYLFTNLNNDLNFKYNLETKLKLKNCFEENILTGRQKNSNRLNIFNLFALVSRKILMLLEPKQ